MAEYLSWLEDPAHTRGVVGSSPTSATIPCLDRRYIILHSDEQQQVQPGEILVAPSTDPAWTPYFISAAGVLTDQGGTLSHGSIIAREYGLPAVTNLVSATRIIRTGDLVRVDGSLGRVTVLERVPTLERGL